jgi:hypothetical protein
VVAAIVFLRNRAISRDAALHQWANRPGQPHPRSVD